MVPALIDLLSRHQVYLEGVKEYQAQHFNVVLRQLDMLLRRMLADLDYETLDQFTKAKLNAFLRRLRADQNEIWNAYQSDFIKFIEAFIATDIEVTKAIYETKTEKSVEAADKENDFPGIYGLLAAIGNKKGNTRLRAIVMGEPIPANGTLPETYLANFANLSAQQIEDTITKGYANNWTPQETLKAFRGTSEAKYRDGLLQRILRGANAVQSTIIQHASSIVNVTIPSLFYQRYRWVSVIDDRTSDICETRNNRIYYYKSGPQPPAHPNCRSRTVAIVDDEGENGPPPSFYVWVKSLPRDMQEFIIGEKQTDLLRSGKLTAKEMGGFKRSKAIPLLDFKRNVLAQLKGK